jgi:acetate kinase
VIVLALNSGSSSLKFGLYRMAGEDAGVAEPVLEGQLDTVGDLAVRLAAADLPAPDAVGHRIVHGGPALRRHAVIDDAVLRQIEAAAPFAPLHTPACLAVMSHSRALFPGLPQVACFDTAFHATLPDVARVLPIPKALQAQGIQRYGFHGLSCESIVHQLARDLPQGLPERLLIAHLGHGASVTAVKAGRSIDTSMGLTPSGGLIMGTRSGDLDPGVLVHLLRQSGADADTLEGLLDQQSGLLGISARSSDMRRLHEAEATSADARLAVRMFCVAVAKQLAAMATVLGGVDLIVFSGGIGEHDAAVRAAVVDMLGWVGIALDTDGNLRGQGAISAAASRCAVRVVASQEDAQIARHTAALLQAPP